MRYLFGLIIPVIVLLLGYGAVLWASTGNGSFVGLLVLPLAPVALLVVCIVGYFGARGARSLVGLALTTLALAAIPPILLLIFNSLVT